MPHSDIDAPASNPLEAEPQTPWESINPDEPVQILEATKKGRRVKAARQPSSKPTANDSTPPAKLVSAAKPAAETQAGESPFPPSAIFRTIPQEIPQSAAPSFPFIIDPSENLADRAFMSDGTPPQPITPPVSIIDPIPDAAEPKRRASRSRAFSPMAFNALTQLGRGWTDFDEMERDEPFLPVNAIVAPVAPQSATESPVQPVDDQSTGASPVCELPENTAITAALQEFHAPRMPLDVADVSPVIASAIEDRQAVTTPVSSLTFADDITDAEPPIVGNEQLTANATVLHDEVAFTVNSSLSTADTDAPPTEIDLGAKDSPASRAIESIADLRVLKSADTTQPAGEVTNETLSTAKLRETVLTAAADLIEADAADRDELVEIFRDEDPVDEDPVDENPVDDDPSADHPIQAIPAIMNGYAVSSTITVASPASGLAEVAATLLAELTYDESISASVTGTSIVDAAVAEQPIDPVLAVASSSEVNASAEVLEPESSSTFETVAAPSEVDPPTARAVTEVVVPQLPVDSLAQHVAEPELAALFADPASSDDSQTPWMTIGDAASDVEPAIDQVVVDPAIEVAVPPESEIQLTAPPQDVPMAESSVDVLPQVDHAALAFSMSDSLIAGVSEMATAAESMRVGYAADAVIEPADLAQLIAPFDEPGEAVEPSVAVIAAEPVSEVDPTSQIQVELELVPESVDTSVTTGGGWTIPVMCLGLGLVACCVIIPQIDSNRQLYHEHAALASNLESVQKQVSVNDEFLKNVMVSPTLAERLASRQMKTIRKGQKVLTIDKVADDGDMSPFALVSVPRSAPVAMGKPVVSTLADLCNNARSRLYLMGVSMTMVAMGLVLGFDSKKD